MISELRTSHLFTPEQLFGDVATVGLSQHAAFLERAKAEAERDELAARFALAAYLVARLIDAYFVVGMVNRGDDGFQWQLAAVRRHIAELPRDATEAGHLSGIVEAVSADGSGGATLRISLTAYAYYLEHEGRFAEGLEVVGLVARTHGATLQAGEFAACALFAARLNRLLARWDEAVACYRAAESAAENVGDHVLRLRGRLGQGAVSRNQGNLPKACTIAEEALREASALKLVEVQLIAYSDLSAVYGMQGNMLAALEADYNAFLLAPDAMERMRALNNLGVGLLEIGAYGAARLAFSIVMASGASFWIRYNAVLELMDLESTVGNRVAFERLRTQAEAERDRMAPPMVADYLRKVGMGFARFGQLSRGRQVLESALAFAEANRLNTWYFKVEASIRDLDKVAEQKAVETAVKPEQASVVQEMEAGLREYASLQLA